ncbi:MAG: hypothetical protein WA876_13980, partial [Candidatus Acidiferrales bacterium]
LPGLIDLGKGAAMLNERINRGPILADAPGIKTLGFAVGKIFFGCCCQRDPAGAVWQMTELCAEPFVFLKFPWWLVLYA